MTSTVLVRTRFDLALLTRLDALSTEVRAIVRRRVPRARLVRALIRLGLDTALAPELATAVKSDTVRQGREKARRT